MVTSLYKSIGLPDSKPSSLEHALGPSHGKPEYMTICMLIYTLISIDNDPVCIFNVIWCSSCTFPFYSCHLLGSLLIIFLSVPPACPHYAHISRSERRKNRKGENRAWREGAARREATAVMAGYLHYGSTLVSHGGGKSSQDGKGSRHTLRLPAIGDSLEGKAK